MPLVYQKARCNNKIQFSCFQVVTCRQTCEVQRHFCNFHCKYNKQWICDIVSLHVTYSVSCELFTHVLESSILWVHHNGVACPRLWMNGIASRHGRWVWTHRICSCGQPTMNGPPACGFNIWLITTHHKTSPCYKTLCVVLHCTHLPQDADTWAALANEGIIFYHCTMHYGIYILFTYQLMHFY